MKKGISILIMIVLIMACSFSLVGCKSEETINEATTIITLDIKAEMVILLDKNGKVICFSPLNEKAEVMFVDFKINSLPFETAIKNIVSLAINMGYLNNIDKKVCIDTVNDNEQKTMEYNRLIFNTIKSYNKDYSVETYDNRISQKEFRSFIRNIKGYENLTFLRYKLILLLKQYNADISFKSALDLTERQITEMLNDSNRNHFKLGSSTIIQRYNQSLIEGKIEISKQISDIIKGEYANLACIYYTAPIIEISIYQEREKKELKPATVEYILKLLLVDETDYNSEKKKMENSIGKITPISMDEYLNNIYLNKAFSGVVEMEKFERILDNIVQLYDVLIIDDLIFEEKTIVSNLLKITQDEEINREVSTISEFIKIKELSKIKMEKLYETQFSSLNKEEKDKINTLSVNLDNIENIVLDEMKDEILKETDRLRELKSSLIQKYGKKNK